MDFLIRWGGTALAVVLLWRLLAWRAWKIYPLFCSYYLSLVARVALLTGLEWYLPSNTNAYGLWFWYSDLFLQLLKLLVAWEVYRKMLPSRGTASRVAGLLLGICMLVLTGFYWLSGAPEMNFFVAVELNFALAIAVWMVGALAIVSYYRYPISLNIWGIAMGIGVLGASYVINSSVLGMDETIFPVFGYVRALSFNVTMVLWTWTLWSYHPSPQWPTDPGSGPEQPDFPGKARERLRRALDL